MKDMSGYKLINVYVFNPAFKEVKARCEFTYCNNSDNCEMYKNGKCVNQRYMLCSILCPHAKRNIEEGFTKRASKFYSWQDDKKKQYAEFLDKITIENSKLSLCGDYVFLPYPHYKNYVNPLDFIVNEHFCKLEDFTVDNIKTLLTFRPRALMGGEITDYQKIHAPKFIQHLKEEMPEKYRELKEIFPELMKIYKDIETNYVGRKAYIKTLKIGAEIFNKGKFIWNGEKLISENFNSAFIPFDIKIGRLELIPEDNSTVEITDNAQVDKNTKFID